MRSTITTLSLVLLLTLTSALIMRWATASGIGLTTDSLRYLNVSRSLLAGDGFTIKREKSNAPMTHFAPLYPAAIATASKLTGLPPDVAVRWLQVGLLSLNVLLLAFLVYRATDGSPLLTVLTTLVATFAAGLIQVHRYALSEGLFLFNQSATLALLAVYLANRHRGCLAGAAVFATAALLTRYAGAALVAACMLAVLLPGGATSRRRWIDCAIFAAISLSLPTAWVVRNLITAQTAVNRRIEFHFVTAKHVDDALHTVGTWIAPPGMTTSLTLLTLGALATLTIVGLLRHPHDKSPGVDRMGSSLTIRVLLIFAGAYIIMLIGSISLIDYYTPLDTRILAPLYPVVLVFVAWVLYRTLPTEPAHVRRLIILLASAVACGQIVRGGTIYSEMHRESAGFTSKRWDDSKLIARVKMLPEDTPLYSNAPDVITLATGRKALGLPAMYDATTGIAHDSFPAEIQAFRTRFRAENNAVLVYFRRVKRPFLPSEGYLRKRVHLRMIDEKPDGALYKRKALTSAASDDAS